MNTRRAGVSAARARIEVVSAASLPDGIDAVVGPSVPAALMFSSLVVHDLNALDWAGSHS